MKRPIDLQAKDLKRKIDFGIISIREDEFQAVLKRLPPVAMIQGRRTYSFAECETLKGNKYQIAVVRAISQGNETSQDVARDMIDDLDPEWLMVVGIAGGVPADEFTLGDVVLATRLIDFTVGALIGEEKHRHEFAGRGGPMDRVIENFLATVKAQDNHLGDWNTPDSLAVPLPVVDMAAEKFYGPDEWKKKIKKSLEKHFNRPAEHRVTYTTGPIVSSDNLMKDPDIVGAWKETVRDLITVEMELAGVYTASRRRVGRKGRDYPILAVRGISDIVGYQRDGAWTGFACHSAASLAAALIKLEPFPPRALRSKRSSKRKAATKTSPAYDSYRKSFEEQLRRYCADVLHRDQVQAKSSNPSLSDLVKRLSEIEVTFSSDSVYHQPVLSLIDVARNKSKVIINGVAGGGKTMTLIRCAAELLIKEQIPSVIIELSRRPDLYDDLKSAADKPLSIEEQFDVLLRASIADIGQSTLAAFPAEKFIMIDGLNELFGSEQRNLILKVAHEYARKNPSDLRILITERQTEQTPQLKNWEHVKLDLLSPDHVEERYASLGREREFEELKKNRKVFHLLRIPFFLAFALENKINNFASATDSIRAYFHNRVIQKIPAPGDGGTAEAVMDHLAQVAFKAYEENKGRSFNVNWFREGVGTDVWKRLEEAGAVENLPDDRARFSHQLLHDFLATKYLAQNPARWNGNSFDIVSFDSNALVQPDAESYDPISITLEQIDKKNIEDFLKRVYDWNWVATVSSLAKARNVDNQSLSPRLELVMLAITAEKHLDAVWRTRQRAERYFDQFPAEVSDEFRNAETVEEVQALVAARSRSIQSEAWFELWVDLFTRVKGSPLSEDDIKHIISTDPIIGWNTSNVIKRSNLDEKNFTQLRAMYESFETMRHLEDQNPNLSERRITVQWRVVHALGSHPSQDNAELLFRALEPGAFWRQYGAGRSLIEMAALGDESLRKMIVDGLKARISNLDGKIKEEICHTAIYRGAPEDWDELIHPLLSDILSTLSDEGDQKVVEEIIEKFSNRGQFEDVSV